MIAAGSGLEAQVVVERSDGFALDVELSIAHGTTAALLGPNGAGKSTVVEALAGLLPLDDGHITYADRLLDDPLQGVFVPPEHRRFGVVFQHYLLFEHLDVLDNVAFGVAAAGVSRHDAREKAHRWVERFDLEELAFRKPLSLSGGQAQRVALARALAIEPDVLLLDEPLAAVDVETRITLRRNLAEHLEQYGGPRLLITHEPEDVFLFADEVYVVEAGRITQKGTPDDIRRKPATDYVAALAGTNLLRGTAHRGEITLTDHNFALRSANAHTSGNVLVTVHPTAVALHAAEPQGSPRNTWVTAVDSLQPLGETVRIILAAPLPIAVDITPAAASSLGLASGTPIWATIKATETAVVSA